MLYLRTDCLDWLLSYAADEVLFQGVISTISETPQSRQGNCPEVPNLQLDWNFTARAWDAEFVDGDREGTTKQFAVNDINAERWAKLTKLLPDMACRKDVSQLQLKGIAKLVIIQWCNAIASGHSDGVRFEEEWSLVDTDTHLETLQKKRRVQAGD